MKTPNQSINALKKTYTPPALIKYGDVRKLTHTGSSLSTEGSGGTGVMKPGSDRNIKQNIVRIGAHSLGIGLYLFDYKPEYRDTSGHGRQFGVMADEVEKVMPEAVSMHPNGFKMVDYDLLGIRRTPH